MLKPTIVEGLIAAVREAARTEILPRFRRLDPATIETKSGPDDLVTIADQRAEVLIAERVRALMPDALIIGEEAVASDPAVLDGLATAELAVLIDPIDGTNNFAKGLAVFGVILAVMVRGQVVYGLLYDPVMDDWISAARGAGVQFGRGDGSPAQPVPPPPVPSRLDALEGFVALSVFDKATQARIVAGYPQFARILSLRCSCHEYRMIAQGYFGFVYNPGDKPWDHAAGALVLEELGGGVFDATGARYDPARSKGPLWAFNFGEAALQSAIKTALGADGSNV